MGHGLKLLPFDHERFRAIHDSVSAARREEAIRLLSAGAPWRDPESSRRFVVYTAQPIQLPGLVLRLGLAADPARYADEMTTWLEKAAEEDAQEVLVEASATAPCLELPDVVDLAELVCPRTVRAAVETALAGLRRGARTIEPDSVRAAGRALTSPETMRPRADPLTDPLMGRVLEELSPFYENAAGNGWAIWVDSW
jgi:hypothetical protein